ncbi:MAG: hypothetical protein IH607_03095, partial [Firmicutes bacterium]|nr:hypothetical protein [Bacillota bacterium]
TYLVASPGAHPWFLYPALGLVWWPVGVYFAKKRQPLLFSVVGFGLIAALFLGLYLAASPDAHPWYLYPLLGAVWWPLSVWGAKKGARTFSVAGGLTVILSLLILNLITSPGFWWWVYPAFFTLWWPVSVLLGKKAGSMAFALGSAAVASLFLIVMYFIQTPHAVPWFLYALLPFFWWPVTLLVQNRLNEWQNALVGVIVFAAYYTGLIALLHGVSSLLSLFLLVAGAWLVWAMAVSRHRSSTGFAAINAALMIAYLYLVHRFVTPDIHPWYWYAYFPLLWWPVAAALKAKAVKPAPVALGAALFLGCYGVLNWALSPGTPWILFLTLPAASAVIGALCYEHKAWAALSVWMAAAGIAYFAAINLVYTPHTVWAVYPAFALLWWPLSMLLFGRKPKDEKPE